MTMSRLPMCIVIAAIIASCGLVGGPPPTVLVRTHNAFGDFAIGVYDHSGLVIDARLVEDERGDDDVIARPETRELVIRWTGGACADSPRIDIDGTPTNLGIALRPSMDHSLRLFVACPAVGIPFAVSLSLTEAVAQTDVRLTVVR